MKTNVAANISETSDASVENNAHVRRWEFVPLGDFAKATGGFGFPLDRQGKKSGQYPFFKVSDMNLVGNRKYMADANNWVDDDDLVALKAKTFPRGAVVFPKIGATIFTNKKRLLVGNSLIDNNVMAIVIRDKRRCDPEFLYQWFQSIDLRTLANSGTVPSITSSRLEALPIPLPPLPEQRKIADLLGLVQQAMAQQERLLALTVELKKTLLHHLFTNGLRHESQKQTELGPIPESWETVKLGELFGIKHGFAFDGDFFKEAGEYILLTPGHFYEEGGFRDQGAKTKYFTGQIPADYLLREGDLLVAMTEQKAGLVGSSAIIPASGKFVHNQRLGLIEELKTARLDKLFLFYLLNTMRVRVEIAKTSSGSKVRHTSPGKIRAVKVALPSLSEQQQIAVVLGAVDAKIDVVKRKHAALSALFRTLLHALMTAKIRVHDLDLSELESKAAA